MITVRIKPGQYDEYANIKSKKELIDFIKRNEDNN